MKRTKCVKYVLMDDPSRPRSPRPSSWRVSNPTTIKKATDDRLKRMIRDGHPDRLLCLSELRARYETRNAKAFDNVIPVVVERCRELVLYDMMCNIHDQFGE